jgi:hypothetical protein
MQVISPPMFLAMQGRDPGGNYRRKVRYPSLCPRPSLLGAGDMLLLQEGRLQRLQGYFVSMDEIASLEARDLRALREGLHDRKDPRTRALFMQWLTVIEHLETAPPEKVTLVQDGTVSGPVDSS